jgi:hypothetical protein
MAAACDDLAMQALALILALIAVACMIVAIGGMVTGRPSDRTGWLVRAVAVICFAAAVIVNTARH